MLFDLSAQANLLQKGYALHPKSICDLPLKHEHRNLVKVGDGVGERVDTRLKVAQSAVRFDGAENFELGGGVSSACRCGRTFSRFGWEAEAELKTFEKRAPICVDGHGVLRPQRVVGLD